METIVNRPGTTYINRDPREWVQCNRYKVISIESDLLENLGVITMDRVFEQVSMTYLLRRCDHYKAALFKLQASKWTVDLCVRADGATAEMDAELNMEVTEFLNQEFPRGVAIASQVI